MAYLSEAEVATISQAKDRSDAEQKALQIYFIRQENAKYGEYEEVTAGVREETDALIAKLFEAK